MDTEVILRKIEELTNEVELIREKVKREQDNKDFKWLHDLPIEDLRIIMCVEEDDYYYYVKEKSEVESFLNRKSVKEPNSHWIICAPITGVLNIDGKVVKRTTYYSYVSKLEQ